MSTSVKVAELPACDICSSRGIDKTAAFDAKTTFGSWGFLCQSCFLEFGPGRLGTGFGQRLYT